MQVGIQNIKILLFVISLGLGFKFLKKKKKNILITTWST